MAAHVLEGLDGRAEDPCTVASRDACVVETDGLAEIVESFVASYKRENDPVARVAIRSPNGYFSKGRLPESALSALDALSERTKAQDPAGIGVPPQTIRNVVQRRYSTVELRTADALVTAAGRPFAYYDGSLVVRPNPRVKGRVQSSCCGSVPASLNGSLSVR